MTDWRRVPPLDDHKCVMKPTAKGWKMQYSILVKAEGSFSEREVEDFESAEEAKKRAKELANELERELYSLGADYVTTNSRTERLE